MLAPEVPAALRTLVDALAARAPIPAGGAAGVAALAMGIALGLKVARFTDGGTRAAQERLQGLLEQVQPMFEADCAAFAEVLAAWEIPKSDREHRAAALARAWRQATEAPALVAKLAREAGAVLRDLRGRSNPGLEGDLDAALTLVAAGERVSADNARGNAEHLEPDTARDLLDELE